MTPKERFEQVIQLIEQRARQPEWSSQEIAMEAARSNGIQLRDMSTIFSYLLSMTLNNYIMSRKLMAAYSFLVNSEKPNTSHAVDLAGYADQPSFHKAFKKMFNMTPKEAFIQKDSSKYVPAITWDVLSGYSASQFDEEMDGAELKETTTFGIPDSAFSVLTEVLDLEAFYGLPRLYSKYAYELAQITDYTLQDCFRYANSLHEYCGDFSGCEPFNQTHEELLHEVADDELIQTVFFARGISVSFLVELRDFYNASIDDLMKCDMTMLKMFPGFERAHSMQFKYYVRAYEYYAKRLPVREDDQRFNGFIDEVMVGKPIEEAYELSYLYADDDDDFDDDFDEDDFMDYMTNGRKREQEEAERYSSIERMAAEEERWHGRSLNSDLDYDAENAGYSDYEEDFSFQIER